MVLNEGNNILNMFNVENATITFTISRGIFIRNNLFFQESCITVSQHVVNELIRMQY